MPEEPEVVSPGWHFSKNDLAFAAELGRWVLAAIAVITLWIQQHNQHVERVAISHEAAADNSAKLDVIAKEVKATQRPLVFSEKK